VLHSFFDFGKLYCVFIKTKYLQLQSVDCLSPAGKSMVKHFRLYGFFTVLGIVLLIIFFTIMFDDAIYNYIWELLSPIQHLLTCLLWFCLLGGPFLLIVGVVGIGRQHFKNEGNLFTVLTVEIVPLLVFFLFYLLSSAALPIG
jgi:hypothetical protein